MDCIICGKELKPGEEEGDVCDSCHKFMTSIHPKSKLKWRLKCHKENAKELERIKQEQ